MRAYEGRDHRLVLGDRQPPTAVVDVADLAGKILVMYRRASIALLAAVAAVTLTSACGRSEAPAETAKPGDPIFKPIDPAAAPAGGTPAITLPAPTPSNAGAGAPPAAGALVAAMVTDMASGWPVNLAMGQEMSARLTADASGAKWSLRTGSDAGIVAMQGAPATETQAGAAMEIFRFKATKPGTTSLTFDLRKGAEAAPIRTVSYPVTVQ